MLTELPIFQTEPHPDDRFQSRTLYIGDQEEPEAYLTYCFMDGRYKFEDFKSSVKGGGRALIKKFCDNVGPGQEVVGAITEINTREYLRQLGFENRAIEIRSDVHVPNDINILEKLRIWWVFNEGGLKEIEFTIYFELNDELQTTLGFRAET